MKKNHPHKITLEVLSAAQIRIIHRMHRLLPVISLATAALKDIKVAEEVVVVVVIKVLIHNNLRIKRKHSFQNCNMKTPTEESKYHKIVRYHFFYMSNNFSVIYPQVRVENTVDSVIHVSSLHAVNHRNYLKRQCRL